MTANDDDDHPAGPEAADRYPSARAMGELAGLVGRPAGPARAA
ncbi:MAG: hypothetical protein JWO38_6665, partial [Gemmataceae bacterium]|nr:hypothetical protein [Gemmataceae bacterium]